MMSPTTFFIFVTILMALVPVNKSTPTYTIFLRSLVNTAQNEKNNNLGIANTNNQALTSARLNQLENTENSEVAKTLFNNPSSGSALGALVSTENSQLNKAVQGLNSDNLELVNNQGNALESSNNEASDQTVFLG
ncbi:hypothetical protein G9A89_009155 [Geosiphon pyriformis]|nr:hypothetical protein G9A89_009155 [Geosiphon pyriformis]